MNAVVPKERLRTAAGEGDTIGHVAQQNAVEVGVSSRHE
jgi:hypothetical protein